MSKLWKLILIALAGVSCAGTANAATTCFTTHMGRYTLTDCDDGSTQTTTRLGRYDYTTTTPPVWQVHDELYGDGTFPKSD
jgi:hypothetical protein